MAFLTRLSSELGITTLITSPLDIHLLLVTRFIRMFAYGSSTLILALYFSLLGHSDTKIGLFMTLTLIGDVLISLLLTLVADGLGRRNILTLGALLLTISGVVFATFENYWVLLAAAVVGVISPSGNEIGPFRAVEESTLAHLSEAKTRSDVFAWYVVFGTLGAAGGQLACGWTTQALQSERGWTELEAYRAVFWVYASLGVVKAGLSMLLSKGCEPAPKEEPPRTEPIQDPSTTTPSESDPLLPNSPPPAKPSSSTLTTRLTSLLPTFTPQSRRTLLKLCALFTLDSLASGMVPPTLTTFYLSRKFPSLPRGNLGTIISSASFTSSLSNIFSASIAKRLGLIKTMVFTHFPSAVLLALLPVPTSVVGTVLVLVGRSALNAMDQAPRTAFLAAVVLPSERTAVYGVVNVVKTAAQSGGPILTGVLAERRWFGLAFVVAGCLKGLYDIGLLTLFVGMRLEGERRERREVVEEEETSGQSQEDTTETTGRNEQGRVE